MKVGDVAPNFKLKDQNGDEISLSGFKGKKVLLSFHPLAWTGVCETQMKNLDLKYDELEKLNVVPLGISVDTSPSKKAWAQNMKINKLKLLSDFWPHGEVAKKYGIFDEENGFSKRANFLIDEEGKIEFVKVYELRDQPDLNEIMNSIKR
ncbi:thioredoxin peroxidase [Petrotoga miotherma DSM 10691]|uniref:Thioredoxin peroxidase n=2 Tax=Petrotoga TaxID=28236 RepID=A0A2K1PF60_9BACT|nr:thioredoxin peroxidase [Petrotoga miotherma DSM 10691]POZ93150.1 thioredoxin peroxidase [Petrotoga halophila DSM 16923]